MATQKNPLQMIRLSALIKSTENTRKTPSSEQDQAELTADIEAHGLLHNLVIKPGKRGRFEVVAGWRRCKALKALQKAGRLTKTHQVPCAVREDDGAEVSVAENIQRAAMHPANEFEAFAELINKGREVADIATCFGKTEHFVLQRLRLGRVAPELREAYRNGETNLDLLMAFTVTDDHGLQRTVWDHAKTQGYIVLRSVKIRLIEGALPLKSKLGRFVRADTYAQSGPAPKGALRPLLTRLDSLAGASSHSCGLRGGSCVRARPPPVDPPSRPRVARPIQPRKTP